MTDQPSQSVVAFDPEALRKGLQDRVRAAFLDVIPEEAWEKMIDAEIKSFFEEKQSVALNEQRRESSTSYGYDHYEISRTEMTPFREIVYDQLRPLVKAEVVERLNSDNFKVVLSHLYNGDGSASIDADMSKFFETLLKKCAPDIVAAMFKGLFAQATSSALDTLRRQ